MAAAEGALTGVQSTVENLRLGIQNNRDVMLHELRSFEIGRASCRERV